jgi:hypothetical protein
MKKASKAKAKSKSKAKAKTSPGKSAPKAKAKSKTNAKAKAALGCCTLTGAGPAQQIEGITQAECRARAIAAGKNDHWVPGKCAQPG